MAQSHEGPKKKGMQDSAKANDYGARAAWSAAAKPPSVAKMVDKGANYKGRES